MRPLAVLNAIVFGSAAAITFGLGGVLVIFLILQGQYPEMRAEFPVLVRSSALFALLAVGFRRQPAGHAEGQAVALAGAGRHVAGGRGHNGFVLAAVSPGTWGKPPKARERCTREQRSPDGAQHLSALADLFPGVALLERAAVVRIEAFDASRSFSCGRSSCRTAVRGGLEALSKRAGSSESSTSSLRPPNHLANHMLYSSRNHNQINRIVSSCEPQDYTCARAGKSPIARIVRAVTFACAPVVLLRRSVELTRGSTRRASSAVWRGACGPILLLLRSLRSRTGAREHQAQQRNQHQRAQRDRPGPHRRLGEIAEESRRRSGRACRCRRTGRAARRRRRRSSPAARSGRQRARCSRRSVRSARGVGSGCRRHRGLGQWPAQQRVDS